MTRLFTPPLRAQKAEDLARLAPLLRNLTTSRRGIMLAPLIAALPASLITNPAQAIDPNETQVTLPDQFRWKPGLPGAPSPSVETAPVFGATDKPGPYVVLIKWHPGYMSAPHTYRPSVLRPLRHLVGEFGESFEPNATVPVPAGGFLRRVANTPHYDGVKKGEVAPAVIGIFGQAPIDFKLVDPSKPPWRAV
jgi:hypothetical protein